ncbi:MAG: hypothetical protein ACD_54C00421G0002 [uncultured bacterium]|nr:MAG: hypothetical protein ACD_54C00421G0002 [uncultured bacterium]
MIAVEFKAMGQPQVLPRQMPRDLTAHQMPRGILDQRQIRVASAFRCHRQKRLCQQRMHLAPALITGFRAQIGSDDNIQRPLFKLIQQAVAGPGFQQEPAPLQLDGQGRQQAGRHLGVEIFNHAQPQRGQTGQIRHRQIGAGLGFGVQDGLGMATKHRPGGGQAHRSGRAIQQNRPQGGLQPGQLLADRRRADAQALGGSRNRALFSDGKENLDPPKRDATLLSGHVRVLTASSEARRIAS